MLGTSGFESPSGIVQCFKVPLSFTFLWTSAPFHPTATSLSHHDAEGDEQPPQTPGLLCSYSANPKERDVPYITNEAWALIGCVP